MTTQEKLALTLTRIGTPQLRLLERLSNAVAVSGDEGEVRKIVLDQIKPALADQREAKVDALGNILVTPKNSDGKNLRVMLAAHMDEVGLMITRDDGNGFYRFDIVGGIDSRQLAGKAVWVGKEHIIGVIGTKPIHLTTREELKRTLEVDDLRVDVGAENKSKVNLGDRVTFANPFRRIGDSLRLKAADDRLGVATLIELLKGDFPQLDLSVAFTVQEEIGLRGAQVAAYALKPQIAIVLDCTPAHDMPAWDVERGKLEEPHRYNTRLGSGAAIYIADRVTLSDPRLVRFFIETAEALKIPYQIRQPGGGGTDAGAIHLTREGVPTISISVPGRYIHTATSIVRIVDWQSTLNLLQAALSRLTPDVLAGER